MVGPAGMVIVSMELLAGSSPFSSQSMVLSRMDASIPAIAVYARQKSAAMLSRLLELNRPELKCQDMLFARLSLSFRGYSSMNMYSCC